MSLKVTKKAFLFFGLSVFLLAVFLPGFSKLQELRDRNRDFELKIRDLNRENVQLAEQLKRLKNDPMYQEAVIRDKMGIVRKGEIPIKLIPKE